MSMEPQASFQLTTMPPRHQLMRPVDSVGLQERATFFNTRKTKGEAKIKALCRLVSLLDLTTLEGADTPGKVRDLCAKALRPLPSTWALGLASPASSKNNSTSLAQPPPAQSDSAQVASTQAPPAQVVPAQSDSTQAPPERALPTQADSTQASPAQADSIQVPPVAAVCVYPNLVPVARQHLKGSAVRVAAVATAFPAGQLPLEIKLQDVQKAIDLGAHEIDMVINRGQFLSGKWQCVFDEIVAVKKLCTGVCLKVILETGELGSYEAIAQASQLALHAGADFIKTSTGKVTENANLPVSLVMLKEILNFYRHTGHRVGLKPAGGVRTAKQALSYLYMLYEEGAEDWMQPKLFRLGASSLLDDILRQICKQHEGAYYCTKTFA